MPKAFEDKLVMGGLAVWAIASCFTRHMCIQFFCLFALTALIYAIRKKYFHIAGAWIYVFFAYFLWHALSLLWVDNVWQGFLQLRVYSLFIFIPLAFCCIKLTSEQKCTVMTWFFRALELYVLASVVTWIIWSCTNGIGLVEWLTTQKHLINYIPSYEIVYSWSNYIHPTYNGIPILIAMAIGFQNPGRKIGWNTLHYAETGVFSVLALLVIVLTQSRICLIGWVIVAFIGILRMLNSHRKIQIAAGAAMVVACIITIALLFSQVKTFFNDPTRVQNFKTAEYCIEQHTVLGSGIEGIRFEMDSDEIAQAIGYEHANKDLANPHHQFIGDWMQTGLVGMALSLAMFILLFVNSIKRRNYMLFVTLAIMLLVANIEMPFYLHKGVVQFLLFTGWFTSDYDTVQKVS